MLNQRSHGGGCKCVNCKCRECRIKCAGGDIRDHMPQVNDAIDPDPAYGGRVESDSVEALPFSLLNMIRPRYHFAV